MGRPFAGVRSPVNLQGFFFASVSCRRRYRETVWRDGEWPCVSCSRPLTRTPYHTTYKRKAFGRLDRHVGIVVALVRRCLAANFARPRFEYSSARRWRRWCRLTASSCTDRNGRLLFGLLQCFFRLVGPRQAYEAAGCGGQHVALSTPIGSPNNFLDMESFCFENAKVTRGHVGCPVFYVGHGCVRSAIKSGRAVIMGCLVLGLFQSWWRYPSLTNFNFLSLRVTAVDGTDLLSCDALTSSWFLINRNPCIGCCWFICLEIHRLLDVSSSELLADNPILSSDHAITTSYIESYPLKYK